MSKDPPAPQPQGHQQSRTTAVERKQTRNTILATLTIGALALSALPAGAALPASTAKEPVEKHCVVTVVDDTDGVLTTGPETCFDTEKEVDAYINGNSIGQSAARSGSNVIGKHFTSTNYGGSSVTVLGTTCSGGVWRPTGGWNNNIESAKHYCGSARTRFYASSSCSGSGRSIYGDASSLGWMNNKTSCVRYG